MDLLVDYGSDDEEEQCSAEKDSACSNGNFHLHPELDNEKHASLPSPDEILKKPAVSTVFKNQYNRESSEISALEKHVKMVENKNSIVEVNGRQVCWMYRRGRCRFGKNCKLYHDSELREAAAKGEKMATNTEPQISCDVSSACMHASEEGFSTKKKKRHGITDALEPPKKAMKEIRRIQRNEQWKNT